MYLVVPPGGSFGETRRIELGPTALTIGRAESCEIRVDIPGVDQEHAKISEVALIALGPDCAIGDVPLDPGSRRLLMPGDEIQIGSVVVALEGDDPSIAPPPMNTKGTDPMPHAPRPMEAPRVRVVEGPNFGDELLMKEEGREYVIGRGPRCDLVIEDREVSREHVKVMRKGYMVYLKDLSSTRGSWLGRAAVYTGSTVEWARPRMLRVGATVLSLDLPDAIRKAAPGAQASAPMTPPPRSRKNMGGHATPSAPGISRGASSSSAKTPMPSEPPPGSASAAAAALADAATRKLGAFAYDPAQAQAGQQGQQGQLGQAGQAAHAQQPPHSAPGSAGGGAGGSTAPGEALAASRGLGALPPASQSRKAWKTSGPTIGKASGLLLLALAGLVILGGLFVVFLLLE